MPDIPRTLALLNDEIKRLNLSVRPRWLRQRAKELGSCYVFGRRTFVTPDQLAQIIDSWKRCPPSKVRQPSIRPKVKLSDVMLEVDAYRRLMKHFADAEKKKLKERERRKRERERQTARNRRKRAQKRKMERRRLARERARAKAKALRGQHD
ncbi:MAG: hypothetical protein F9K29_03630 [Hyphomicrobiaceae bacterium]|nr:MAG: hypothetical protein F9K29_03630 [Hyphomicrobiaceae bacterium]